MSSASPQSEAAVLMGLNFAGRLGVAAGVDRNGQTFASLDLAGFGHFEIGTITPDKRLAIDERPPGLLIGVNFGASGSGLNDEIIDEYCAAMADAFPAADYLCANLSSPRVGRDGDSQGVDRLIARVAEKRDMLAAERGCWKPLLLKLNLTVGCKRLPAALSEAKRQEFDGLVLECSDQAAIAEARNRIAGLTLISVGRVRTACDVARRLSVGADLVQIHSAFIDGTAQLWTRDDMLRIG
jgi:dihydroorotate dehydrogenase